MTGDEPFRVSEEHPYVHITVQGIDPLGKQPIVLAVEKYKPLVQRSICYNYRPEGQRLEVQRWK